MESSSPELLREIIEEEILPRASVESLLKFRCVSKTWRSLIDSERFINKHLHNSTRTRTRRCCSRAIFNHCVKCRPPFWPSYDLPPSLVDFWYVVGHHNGLLCIYGTKGNKGYLILSNPATRSSASLPSPQLIFQKLKLGFGREEHSGVYKVFVGVADHDIDGGRIARIYSSETNSWRQVEHGSASLKTKVGVFVCGKIYWLTRSGHIEYLDLRNEAFGKTMIAPPRNMRLPFGDGVCVWLWERRGSLCIVCDTDNFTKRTVWVMNGGNWEEDSASASASASELGYEAFPYIESLISPPPLPSSSTLV